MYPLNYLCILAHIMHKIISIKCTHLRLIMWRANVFRIPLLNFVAQRLSTVRRIHQLCHKGTSDRICIYYSTQERRMSPDFFPFHIFITFISFITFPDKISETADRMPLIKIVSCTENSIQYYILDGHFYSFLKRRNWQL